MPPSAAHPRQLLQEAAAQLQPNPEQWAAYESTGHCVVLAGPGSGKTKTLTTKLARMLLEDVRPPRGIACVTYSSECARELTRRLASLGVASGPNVFIGTVHSFCLANVVVPFARLAGLPLPEPLTVANKKAQTSALQDALDKVIDGNQNPADWRTRFDRYRRTIARDSHEWSSTDPELAKLIEVYEEGLRKRGLVDFDDMVLIGLQLIEKHAWVRRVLHARFPILAVDEYQDLGVPLHRIVVALCLEGSTRLFAVGDPDQSIYGFTGARPELLLELVNADGVASERLRFNYRSGATIVKAASVTLGEDRGYEAKAGSEGTIDIYCYPNGLAEQAKMICEEIIPGALSRRAGRALGDVAVLYKDQYVGNEVAQAAQNAGLKFVRVDQGAPYPKTPVTRWLEQAAAWCAGGWKSGSPTLTDLVKGWLGFNRGARLASDRRALQTALVRFLRSHRDPATPLTAWLAAFRSDLLVGLIQREPTMTDEEDAIAALEQAVQPGKRLHGAKLADLGGQGGSPDHLNLMTLHSVKGLEFEVVTLVGMEDDAIPGYSAKTKEGLLEARRLFYVGLTRAKQEIHITYSGWVQDRYKRRWANGPSRFVLEVKKWLDEAAGA